MTQAVRRIYRATLALLVVVCAVPAKAQTATPPDQPARTVEFLPRSVFHMSAEHLSGDDPRYVWDAEFGGALDVVDYGTGRLTFEANYQVVLGEEIRAFDPNQGNYILAGNVSARLPRGIEAAAQLYHQSRHLADRPKRVAVDWNMLGGRVRKAFSYNKATFDARADMRGVFMKATVLDYSWEVDAGVRSNVKVHPQVTFVADVDIRYLGVDGSLDRGNQTGYRAEGGFRFEGRAGAIELFIAGERRIDPYPVEVGVAQWITAGFRLLSRSSGR